MNIERWIDTLEVEGVRMADIGADLSLDSPVPSCPKWKVRQLIRHTSWAQRWACLMVLERRTQPPRPEEVTPEGWPPDEQLVDWFREGHLRLVSALQEATDDLECWTMNEMPQPRAFWARRMAHETAIHRVDIEMVAGEVTDFDPEHAADGVDEMVGFFIFRPDKGPRAPEPQTLRVVASDTGRHWTVSFGPDTSSGQEGGSGPVDCTITGNSSDLYICLWNRVTSDDLLIEGDSAVLEYWGSGSF